MRAESPIFENTLLIKEHHLDTYGHVNNATYIALLEEIRWDLVTRRGYGLEDVMREKKGPIILDISIRFSRELANREVIRVTTQLKGYNGKIGKIQQTVYKENGEKSCTAEFTYAFFDLERRKIIPGTPNWLKAVGLADD